MFTTPDNVSVLLASVWPDPVGSYHDSGDDDNSDDDSEEEGEGEGDDSKEEWEDDDHLLESSNTMKYKKYGPLQERKKSSVSFDRNDKEVKMGWIEVTSILKFHVDFW